MEKPADTDHPIEELLARRWSPRAFDPDRPVARETLLRLLEAARWAPSCFNEQPWRFLVFDGAEPEALEQARGCLTEGNAWAKRAPVLLLSVACELFARNDRPNRHAQHDVGLAAENLVLQATALGLATHQMAGFDAQRAREAFRIPEGYTPMAMIAVGHPGDPSLLSEKHLEKETAPRTRRPVGEFAFAGRWERAY